MFRKKSAWFSNSVPETYRQLWGELTIILIISVMLNVWWRLSDAIRPETSMTALIVSSRQTNYHFNMHLSLHKSPTGGYIMLLNNPFNIPMTRLPVAIEGGSSASWRTADYLFSEDADCPDTQR